ncbi:YlbF family regulator [Risungbinella massiliensis]|uniref:YlbF family regulator n=1 Tax=Risungbinella massiliensis TaxID=1329796 RepID=UPI0005CC5221|nr:YlbF family regulator [Risungbinella massiliensis]
MKSIDMAELILDAYQLADELKESPEVQEYLIRKKQMEQCSAAQKLIQEFQQAKLLFEETRRFGIFHPNYHEAKERAEALQRYMNEQAEIGAFQEAEKRLDQLLFQISNMLAKAVSNSIKVPNDFALTAGKKKACSI